MNNLKKELYIFSKSKEDIFIGKYLNIIVIVAWFLLLIFESLWGVDFPTLKLKWPVGSFFIALPVFFVLGLLFSLSLSKLAYQVVFDFQNGIVKFFMYKKLRVIIREIADLDHVKIDWHTHFIFKNGETIRYKANNAFFMFLKERNIPRKWGGFGKLFLKKA